MLTYKKICLFLFVVTVIFSLILATGCVKTTDTQEIKMLQEKVENLESKLSEIENKQSEEETTVDTIAETVETILVEETTAAEDTQITGDTILKDKICLIDNSPNDFTKFQTLGYNYDLNLIKDFESAAYSSISLAILFKPDDARLTKLYDYISKGGKGICYYYEYSTKYNDNKQDY